MNPIDALFKNLRSEKRKAFIPFITAGDPNIATTDAVVGELKKRGASIIEIGFPYSDPIADGSVIQASYTRALENGLHIDDIFAWARRSLKSNSDSSFRPPLIAMVSYSLVHHRGCDRFLSQALEAGFSGAVVPDLPIEEVGTLGRLAADKDFALIHLVTPTTPRDRAMQIARASTGFLYCVSVTGITGERTQLPAALLDQLRWLRGQTDLPLCVGFGISNPEHVRALRDLADGIIVGSALVRKLENAGKRPLGDVVRDVGTIAQSLADELNPAGSSH